MATTRIAAGAASVNNTLSQNSASFSTWFSMITGQDGQASSPSEYQPIAVDSNGNVYYVMENNGKGCIVKFSSTGNLIKFIRTGNTGSFQALEIDASNNIYVAKTYEPDSATGFTLTKFNSDLTQIWQKDFDWGSTSQNPQPRMMKLDSAGSFGYIATYNSPTVWGVVKFNTSTGVVVAGYSFSVNSDTTYSVEVDPSGNIYFGGQSNSGLYYSPHIHKLNSSGTWGWGKYMSTNSGYSYPSGRVNDIETAPDGSIYFSGSYQVTATAYKNFVVKVSNTGTVAWKRNITAVGGSNQYAGGGYLDIDSSGNVYAMFRCYPDNVSARLALVKFDSSGNVLWQRILYNPISGNNLENGNVKLDHTGNFLYLTFYTNIGVNYACILKVPTDGTKTGTYAAGGANAVIYAAGSNSIADDANSNVANVSSAPAAGGYTYTNPGIRTETILPFPGVTAYVTPIV